VLPLRRGLRLKPLSLHLLDRRAALKALSNSWSRLAADMPNLVVSPPRRTRTVYLAPILPSSSLSIAWKTGRRVRRVCLADPEGPARASRAGSLSPSTMSSRVLPRRGRCRRPTAAVAGCEFLLFYEEGRPLASRIPIDQVRIFRGLWKANHKISFDNAII
jgi:hypothetical protein